MGERITIARNPRNNLWGQLAPEPLQSEFRPARQFHQIVRYFERPVVLSDVQLKLARDPVHGAMPCAEGLVVEHYGGRPIPVKFDQDHYFRLDTGAWIEGCRRMLFTPRLIWGDFAPPQPMASEQREEVFDLMV